MAIHVKHSVPTRIKDNQIILIQLKYCEKCGLTKTINKTNNNDNFSRFFAMKTLNKLKNIVQIRTTYLERQSLNVPIRSLKYGTIWTTGYTAHVDLLLGHDVISVQLVGELDAELALERRRRRERSRGEDDAACALGYFSEHQRRVHAHELQSSQPFAFLVRCPGVLLDLG